MRTKKNNFGDRVNEFISEPGSELKRMFHGKVDRDTGEIKLIEDKPKNLYEEIQSYKDSVDVNKIIERFQNGEVDILNQIQGVYADVSTMPKSLSEAYGMIEEEKYKFDRLSPEIKSKFNNDFGIYLNEFASAGWIEKLGIGKKEEKEEVKEE